ncbi:hypothetical protein NY057_05105 [Curtobacterium flaccumfaciens]|uniref:hypothetical protein n=1 Tax=Curtobacterium flaccumfaciens TaxID=2035 RepID=UPI002201B15D|nr:hypothetical protein [Curtobacterium flaccumfaciens]UWD83624.1 hypothetical protein NY057_05105 [Curtobacterium flaccumfaciens]
MSRPRTLEHFPRMKVRGGRRRLHSQIGSIWTDVSEAASKAGRVFVRISAQVGPFVEAMERVRRQLRIATLAGFWLARRQARDQWLSRRMLPATPSPWAAPIRKDAP